MKVRPRSARRLAFFGLVLATRLAAGPVRIEVVEKGSGWPVPLVELTTTHHVAAVTDNAGVAALDVPELAGTEVFLHVASDGYEVPKDGFGFRGVRLRLDPGKPHRIEVDRTMIARRLGRLTGGGLFAESQRTGTETGWRESGILGCDSVQTAVHRGRRFWLWGDTTLARHPLGIFDSSGATTAPRPFDRFEPPLRPEFEVFRDDKGRPRGITPMPGDGPTWATAMVSLPDRNGTPRLVCTYMKIRGFLEAYEWGLATWNEDTARFDRLKVLWTKSPGSPEPPPLPRGHAVPWTDGHGKAWILFAHPFPTLRCPATFEAWQDPSTWEPMQPQTEVPIAGSTHRFKPHNGVHSGAIGWHAWRKRWVAVLLQTDGTPSRLGELWYAEADAPTGPWGPAVKVLTHRRHTFYNPCIHPDLGPEGKPVLLFEGTYTKDFSNGATPTPRHDYNQILYRLDLDDPRLKAATVTSL